MYRHLARPHSDYLLQGGSTFTLTSYYWHSYNTHMYTYTNTRTYTCMHTVSLDTHTIITSASRHHIRHIHPITVYIYCSHTIHSYLNNLSPTQLLREQSARQQVCVSYRNTFHPSVPCIVLKDLALVLEKPGSKLWALLLAFRHFMYSDFAIITWLKLHNVKMAA